MALATKISLLVLAVLDMKAISNSGLAAEITTTTKSASETPMAMFFTKDA
jgi:hypothetical protein